VNANTVDGQVAETTREDKLTLDLLDAIENQENISQRHLSQHMGIALGLTNSYLKRCVKKGWIKITTAPANRYLYYLTPKGFAEKARLTGEFLSTSLTLFRQAGDSYSELFDHCEKEAWRSVLFAGLSDLAEIAYLRSIEKQVSVAGIYEPSAGTSSGFGVPVLSKFPGPGVVDAVLITTLADPLDVAARLEQYIDASRILMPPLLISVSTSRPAEPREPDSEYSAGRID
jgi:DNA-binding MarR family transcriptional regulator